jgi:KTSC domain
MQMIPVASSDLAAVGYNTETRKLIVQFHNGTYEYSNVPENVYRGLMSASSKGRYLHQFIKNHYPYRRI